MNDTKITIPAKGTNVLVLALEFSHIIPSLLYLKKWGHTHTRRRDTGIGRAASHQGTGRALEATQPAFFNGKGRQRTLKLTMEGSTYQI